METPKSIRTSLILGEWVSSIDLSDAYLHIPIHPNSRKYLRFCYRSQVFQFTSLPFGLATAPPGVYNDCKGSEANGPLQNPTNVMRGADLHPKDHSIQLFTDASNEGWGAHLDQSSTKGLWSDREKRLHINVLELKAVSLTLRSFKDQCQNQTVLVATDNSTVVAYINKQRGTHSAEMCALLWKIMTWCHRYHTTLKARHRWGP